MNFVSGHDQRLQRNVSWGVALLTFFSVFFFRTWLVYTRAVDIPWADQWDSEIDILYRGYVHGQLGWDQFWSQGNEHRVVLTKLFNLFVFIVDGNQYKQIHQLILNNVIYALIPAILVGLLNRSRTHAWGSIVLLCLFAAPIGWENLYWSYQSQVYFSMLFSVLAGWVLSREKSSLFLLTVITIVAGFGNAAAFYAPTIGVVLFMMRGVKVRAHQLSAIYCLVLAIVSAKLFVAPTPGHAIFIAQSVSAAVAALIRYSAFPMGWGHFFWPVLVSVAIFTAVRMLRGVASSFADRFPLYLTAWFLCFLASSFLYRTGFDVIPPRYYDYYLFGGTALVFFWCGVVRPVWKGQEFVAISAGLLLCFVLAFRDEVRRDIADWKEYAEKKMAYSKNLDQTLAMLRQNPSMTPAEILVQLKKLPLPYAGYPIYEGPVRMLHEPFVRRMLEYRLER